MDQSFGAVVTSKPEELVTALQQIDQMFETGALPPDAYYKCIVTMASAYLCDHLDAEQALVLLNRVPAAYYLDVLPGQMREDGLFAQVSVELGYRLVQLGLAAGMEAHVANMKEAKA